MNYLAHGWRRNPGIAWVTALVFANALLYSIVPIFARNVSYVISLWLGHLGLAACWLAWGNSALWKRGPSAVAALLLCSLGAWDSIRWENQSWIDFVGMESLIFLISCILLRPFKPLTHDFWHVDDPVICRKKVAPGQFTLRDILAYTAAVAIFLGIAVWCFGEQMPGMLAFSGGFSFLSIAGVVPIVGVIMSVRYRWLWLGSFGVATAVVIALQLRHVGSLSEILDWPNWVGVRDHFQVNFVAALNVGMLRILCPHQPSKSMEVVTQ